MFKAFLLLLLLRNSHQLLDNTCAEIYPKDAKNIFVLFTDAQSFNEIGRERCQESSKDALADIFNIQFEINKLNANKGFDKFGVLICNTCSDDYLSKRTFTKVIDIVQQSRLNLLAIFASTKITSLYELLKKHDLEVPIINYATAASNLFEITHNHSIQYFPNELYKFMDNLKMYPNDRSVKSTLLKSKPSFKEVVTVEPTTRKFPRKIEKCSNQSFLYKLGFIIMSIATTGFYIITIFFIFYHWAQLRSLGQRAEQTQNISQNEH